jgi:signal transduction histidine kinase
MPTHLVGQPCHQVIHGLNTPPTYCPNRTAEQGQTASAEFYEARLQRACLCTAWPFYDSESKLTGTVNVLKDITKEKELHTQLIQSEKLATVGQLSASLAHEINNPLQSIQGCLDLVQMQAGDAHQSDKYLVLARNELGRLKTIVERMVDFNRPAQEEWTYVDLQNLVEDVIGFCSKRIEQSHITVCQNWCKQTPLVRGICNHLRQVILNLVLNAIDSMPDGGTLTVQSAIRKQHGLWLAIDISDSGAGIKPDNLEKIFEPFYTTKQNGTGLGLPICRTIMDDHNGRLSVASKLGKGSTFTIWLPAA